MADIVNHPAKYCGRCKKILPIRCFAKNRVKKDGLQERCRRCRKEYHILNRDVILKRRKKYNRRDRLVGRLKKHGMSLSDFKTILELQGNVCGICGTSNWGRGKEFNTPHIDHNHKTGCVRGLLCNNCNRGLGFLGDSLKKLKKAVLYLEEI